MNTDICKKCKFHMMLKSENDLNNLYLYCFEFVSKTFFITILNKNNFISPEVMYAFSLNPFLDKNIHFEFFTNLKDLQVSKLCPHYTEHFINSLNNT